MYLFELSSRHMHWLADRQAVIAGNIANADTPGFRARDMNPFEVTLDQTGLQLAATSPLHFRAAHQSTLVIDSTSAYGRQEAHSGNSVSLETELLNASQTSRMMSIDSSVTRSFHRMVLTSLKV